MHQGIIFIFTYVSVTCISSLDLYTSSMLGVIAKEFEGNLGWTEVEGTVNWRFAVVLQVQNQSI